MGCIEGGYSCGSLGDSDAPNIIRLATLNCNGLWSRAGRLNSAFHGFARFLRHQKCDVAFLQETNTPVLASLPQDQPYCFDGLEDTRRHDAAFLVHHDIAASCAQIPGIRNHSDICWRLLNHAEDHLRAPTAFPVWRRNGGRT